MTLFHSDVKQAEVDLDKAKFKRKMFRIITIGVWDNPKITSQATVNLQKAIENANKYDSLLFSAQKLDDELLNCVEIEGVRVSKNAFADFSSKISKGYPKDWEQLRELVLTRDNYQCKESSTICSGPLQIHHKILLSRGGSNRIQNLITLCHYHHCQKHDHMREKYYGNFRG